MKSSIRLKLFILCIVLVVLTTVGVSLTYYILTTQYMNRESQRRIQMMFKIIVGDITAQLSEYTSLLGDFLQNKVWRDV